VARLAVPDTNRVALDSGLSAECANVFGVLGDFHLLNLFTKRSTISGTVFTGNTDLLSTLGHFRGIGLTKM